MKRRIGLILCGLLISVPGQVRANKPITAKEPLVIVAAQKEFLTLEPILVTVRLNDKRLAGLPAGVNGKDKTVLRFEIQPPVKSRQGAKPLELEKRLASSRGRIYDLLEWYQFPAQGTFKVTAVVKQGDTIVTSSPITISLRRPDKKDPEAGPVDRLHHMPWSNYVSNAFCGDTFDVVKRWPDSRLAPYCHYWNGLHHQHKKDYDKAMASFRTVVDKYSHFILAGSARFGIAECLYSQNKLKEAFTMAESMRPNAIKLTGSPGTLVELAEHLMVRVHRELAK